MLSRLLGKGFFFENQIPHPPRHFLKVLIGRGGPKIYRTQSIATTVIGSDKRSQKERDWTKMQLSLPGEGKSHSNLASWHNDNDFCLGRGGGPSTKLLCISAYPKGGAHPLVTNVPKTRLITATSRPAGHRPQ